MTQELISRGTSPCKRDALPTELTARSSEISAFPEVEQGVNSPPNGTERKRAGLKEQQSPEIVPKCSCCDKRLSRKTARIIDGKVLCSPCMFAPTATLRMRKD